MAPAFEKRVSSACMAVIDGCNDMEVLNEAPSQFHRTWRPNESERRRKQTKSFLVDLLQEVEARLSELDDAGGDEVDTRSKQVHALLRYLHTYERTEGQKEVSPIHMKELDCYETPLVQGYWLAWAVEDMLGVRNSTTRVSTYADQNSLC